MDILQIKESLEKSRKFFDTVVDKPFCHFTVGDYLKFQEPLTKEDLKLGIKILLIRPSSMGDVLFVTPLLKQLCKMSPYTGIDVMTLEPLIFKHNPYCHKTLGLNKKYFSDYDKIFFLSYEFAPLFHPVDVYSYIVGIDKSDKDLEIYLSNNEKERIKKNLEPILKSHKKKKIICLHGECNWRSRRWPKDNWISLVDKLNSTYKDHLLISLGTKLDGGIPGTFYLRGLGIRHVMGVLDESDLNICIDSGIMHLSVALKKPTISIFSITKPELRLPTSYLMDAFRYHGSTAGMHHYRECLADKDISMNESILVENEIRSITSSVIFGYVQTMEPRWLLK